MTHVHDWRTAVPANEFEDAYEVCRTCFVRKSDTGTVYDARQENIDAVLAAYPAKQETAISTAAPRRHRHVYDLVRDTGLAGEYDRACRCGAIQDPDASRRGRTIRSYGNRAELKVAKMYGGRKVGHAQGPTDVVGKTRKVQVKTTRRSVPVMWRSEFAKLESERDGRLAILLLRFVQPGNLGPDDYIVLRGKDFLEWYGPDSDE